jgi:hypothetical protein
VNRAFHFFRAPVTLDERFLAAAEAHHAAVKATEDFGTQPIDG